MSRIAPLLPERYHGLLIAGEWGAGAGGDTIEVTDPASEEVIASVPSASLQDGLAALDAAQEAAPAWRDTAPRARGEILRRSFALMTEQSDNLARLIVAENGKTLAEAEAEVAYAAEFFRWFSEEAVRWPGLVRTAPSGANRILLLSEPVGISLLITPWNAPAAMLTRKMGAALAAGCTVVAKPASDTPLIACAIGHILETAGLPAGVVNIVHSRQSSELVIALLRDGRVRKLSFTGSTEVGRKLLSQASEHIVNCSMELGGNAPFIVLDDADLKAAIEGAFLAKMRNAGISCVAANRIYVASNLARDFIEGLSKAMDSLTVGPGLTPGVDVGPLVSRAERDRISSLVDEAIDEGGRARIGGKAPETRGFFYLPTVLEGIDISASVLRSEIFGPVAPIVPFDDVDDIINEANVTPSGLVAYIYTRDLGRAMGLAERLECGMVGINRGMVSDPAAPFGGTKESGIGREGGSEGLAEYLETKYIATHW